MRVLLQQLLAKLYQVVQALHIHCVGFFARFASHGRIGLQAEVWSHEGRVNFR